MTNPLRLHTDRAAISAAEWRAAGARVPGLEHTHVLVIACDDRAALGAAALGVASAAGPRRRVAVFDIAGAFGAESDDDGLLLAFRDGRSLNALARPLEATSLEHFVVPTGPGEIPPDFASHERWPRLVEGFRATDSLLVLLIPSARGYAPGSVRLIGQDSGVARFAGLADRTLIVSEQQGEPHIGELETPPTSRAVTPSSATPIAVLPSVSAPPRAPVATADAHAGDESADADIHGDTADAGVPAPVGSLAAAIAPAIEAERTLPRTTPTIAPRAQVAPSGGRMSRRWERRIVLIVLVAAAVGGEWIWSRGRLATDDGQVALPVALAVGSGAAPSGDAELDTLNVPDVVNPADAARATAWGVELVVTNNRDDARFWLEQHTTLAATTVSTLWVEGDLLPWYSLITGALPSRADAVQLRTQLRRAGVIDQESGVIANVPYALRIEGGLTPERAQARALELRADSIAAYALRDADGTAAVYAGAFTVPEQAIYLLAELRRKDLEPVFAFRVGRTY